MTGPARALLDSVQQELAPREDDNRLVPMVRAGTAPRDVLAAVAAEEHRIVPCDWRSFLTLATRAQEQPLREFFTGLAQGEGTALGTLPKLSRALGWSDEDVAAYRPKAGCQAYPAYMSWLALHAEPADQEHREDSDGHDRGHRAEHAHRAGAAVQLLLVEHGHPVLLAFAGSPSL